MSWPLVKLGNICTLLNGRAYKKPELLQEGKYPVLRVGNFFSNREWYYSDLELPDKNYCDNGDLLYAWSASFGPKIWDGGKVIYHYHIWKLLLDESLVDKDYLYHALSQDVDRIKQDQGSGSTMIHVTKSAMEERELPLPPLKEQKRVAAILDKADNLRRKRQQAIQLADEFLRAVFLDIFGEIFTTKGYENSRRIKIGELTSYIDYRGKTPEKSDFGVPLITAKNVKMGFISEEPREFIPEENYFDWMSRGLPEQNDVLFTTEAPLGNVALLGNYEKVVVGQRLISLRSLGEVTQEFLMHALLNGFVRGMIEKRSSGSTVKGIRTKELYEIEIPIPDIRDQNRFSKIYWKIRGNQELQTSAESVTETLCHSVSKKAFSGAL